MEGDTKTENYTRMSQYRGLFLDTMINLETICSLLIAVHFCGVKNGSKIQEFLHTIAYKENFSLSFKFGLIRFILKNHFPKVLEDKKSLPQDFDKLLEMRNHFAHREYDTDCFDGIAFVHYKTDRNKIKERLVHFTQEEFEAHLNTTNEITNTLIALYEKIKEE